MTTSRFFPLAVVAACLVAAACDITSPADVSRSITVEAEAMLLGDTVYFAAEFTNRTGVPVEITWGDCGEDVGAVLLVSAAPAAAPSWSFDDWRRQSGSGCYPVGYSRTLQPFAPRWITRKVAAEAILGDSLPAGQYHLSVVPAVSSDMTIPRTPIPVGTIHLAQ